VNRYRVTSTKLEEIHTGATFLPGEEAIGFDPTDPDDARKLDEGLFVEIQTDAPREPSEAVLKKAEELDVDLETVAPTGKHGDILVADVEKAAKNQEENK
jgi:pyruvate/2-oxoglutarate dehydrogenase complex dihydrolipoamide acyltransferase (E2) component